MRVRRQPRPPAHARRAVHQGHPLHRAHLPPGARAARRCKRVGPQGQRAVRAASAGTRRWTTSPRASQAIAARDPQAILPYSYAGTMGLVQGESMAARFFHRLGASLLDRTICSSAGGEALAATYGGKVGMHVEHFAESRLILIWGSNSIASNLHFWTLRAAGQARRREAGLHRPAPDRDGREVPPAHRAAARHRRRAGAGPDARADRQRLAGPRLHRAPCRRLAGAARARAAVAARARGRGLRHHAPTRCAQLARDYGTHAAGGDPPELRHAARARRRQRGARWSRCCPAWSAPGASAPAGCCCRPRAGSSACATTPRCSGPTCWPGARRAPST